MSAETIADELEAFVRTEVLNRLPSGQISELAQMKTSELLIVYANWSLRIPLPIRRAVTRSDALDSNPKLQKYHAKIAAIESDIKRGQPLHKYLSRGILFDYVDKSSRPVKRSARRDIDGLLSDWGIHHLHLSTVTGPDGFASRTADLLFVAFRGQLAYLIDILPARSHVLD